MSIFKKNNQTAQNVEYLLSDNVPPAIADAFHALKTSLSVFIPKKQDGKGTTLVITSPANKDGKTTVAVNLAMMFAQTDAKVVLVDCDLRSGNVAKYYKAENTPGLTEFISGQNTLEEVTRKPLENENFSYISCGTTPPRPYEILESKQLSSLLEELKKGIRLRDYRHLFRFVRFRRARFSENRGRHGARLPPLQLAGERRCKGIERAHFRQSQRSWRRCQRLRKTLSFSIK